MRLGAIADDFTGASDLANTLARRGMRTLLYVGAPGPDAPLADAGVVALKSRSNPVDEAVSQSLAALEALQKRGVEQVLFKYCSTFDSTKEGNIGPVADALIDRLGAEAAIVCPAFPTNGRTIYKSHLFVNDGLLNESGMERHPITPMTDANIARWLSYQSKNRVGRITLETVRKGVAAVAQALAECAKRNEKLVVCDATSDEDLFVLGHAAKGAALVTGGSGIALGLPDNFAGRLGAGAEGVAGAKGPALAIAGSCSRATNAQVAHHAGQSPVFALDVEALMAGSLTTDAVFAWLAGPAKGAALPLIYSTADAGTVQALQARYAGAAVAHKIERFFATLAKEAVARGYRRLIIAGGETSSAVVSALGMATLAIGPEIDPGVPVVVSEDTPRLALALKSGNFGAPDFFMKALGVMEAMP